MGTRVWGAGLVAAMAMGCGSGAAGSTPVFICPDAHDDAGADATAEVGESEDVPFGDVGAGSDGSDDGADVPPVEPDVVTYDDAVYPIDIEEPVDIEGPVDIEEPVDIEGPKDIEDPADIQDPIDVADVEAPPELPATDADVPPPDAGPPPPVCPNGAREPGEVCDGSVLCASLYGDTWIGTATCSDDCTTLDASACRTVLGTIGWPATSCAAIPKAGVDDPSAVFWIDSGDGPRQLYCDLDGDGGGWTLVSSRPYLKVPGPWGIFIEGDPVPTPESAGVLAFLDLFPAPTAVRIAYHGEDGGSLVRQVAPGAAWESLGNGLRIAVDGGAYLIFSNQPSAQGEAVCVTTGSFDSGFKCDGNEGQLEGGQGLFSLFAEDEFCNCDSYGWKADVGGCEADVCAPEGLVSVYLK